MRRPERIALSVSLAVLLAGAFAVAGCSTHKASTRSAVSTAAPAPGAAAADLVGKKTEMPKELEIGVRLAPGRSWKSRFVSTSEVTWTYTGADGKAQTRSRTVGLDLVAVQTVVSVSGHIARIEVNEMSARILRDGKFIDAPFRQFGPPNPVAFTLDVGKGTADFSEMEKAYEGWMGGVRTGAAGEILGKSFRVDAYVAQLREIYGKPFLRVAGKKLAKGASAAAAKEMVLPFLGPGSMIGPIPVETFTWHEGIEMKKETGEHFLKVAGKYGGGKELSAEELGSQLLEFGVAAPKEFQSSAEISGLFESSVDVMSGREVAAKSQLRYSTTASFDGGTIQEEIAAKSLLEPAD